jgi:hypothetical protein
MRCSVSGDLHSRCQVVWGMSEADGSHDNFWRQCK